MGWSRFFTYMKQRIIRLADSPHNIAAGLAMGISISFTPFVGTHIIQVGALAYITRGNVLAAALATAVGNPLTFLPFFWGPAIIVGSFIFKFFGFESDITHIDLGFEGLIAAAKEDPLNILLPWTVGGYLLAFLTWPIGYAILYPTIKAAKVAREKLIAVRKAHLEKRGKTASAQLFKKKDKK